METYNIVQRHVTDIAGLLKKNNQTICKGLVFQTCCAIKKNSVTLLMFTKITFISIWNLNERMKAQFQLLNFEYLFSK